jgi:hypothetical protein
MIPGKRVRRRGFINGSGGGDGAVAFLASFRPAPDLAVAVRSTAALMFDVHETNFGSEMADFCTTRLRCGGTLPCSFCDASGADDAAKGAAPVFCNTLTGRLASTDVGNGVLRVP